MKSKKKKSNRKKFIILILLLFALVGGCLFYNYKELKIIFKRGIIVNINDEVYNLDYVGNIKNGTIISEKELIDTSKLGKQSIEIKIKDYFGNIKIYKYDIEIVDREKPKIEYTDKITITEGDNANLLKNVKVSDNSKEEIKATVLGDYDFNKVGEYELFYVAKDSSGNEAKEKFILEVKKKVVNVTDNIKYFTTSKGFSGYTKDGITYIDGVMVVNKTYSIPSSYNVGDITSETRSNMNKMFADAASIGLNIYLSSGFRSYNTQNIIYNNYVNQDGKEVADTYSARPGHSEHQTGLAFDVNQIDNTFDDTPEANWLSNNCYKYGFILRYPKGKSDETGYMYESWHFRYVGTNLASKLYNNGDWITLESYFGITSKYNY